MIFFSLHQIGPHTHQYIRVTSHFEAHASAAMNPLPGQIISFYSKKDEKIPGEDSWADQGNMGSGRYSKGTFIIFVWEVILFVDFSFTVGCTV